jgi:enoyl-CoA hydratase/carnithine racemase
MVVTDFAVTHADARVGYPEVSLGLCPAVVAPWLIRRIGAGRARAMLLQGRTVTGREALDLALATHLADRGALDDETRQLARTFADGSAKSLATTKRWLNDLEGLLDDATLTRGADLSAEVLAGPDAQARLKARFGGR